MIETRFTKEQINTIEIVPANEVYGERIVYSGMPDEYEYKNYPMGKIIDHPTYGKGYEILNPYFNPSQKASKIQLFRHRQFDLLHSLCAIQDGYADGLSSSGIFGTAMVRPIKFIDPVKSLMARTKFMNEGDWPEIKDRNHVFLLMRLGIGFGTVWYSDPDPNDAFARENPTYPGNFRNSDINKAKRFSTIEQADSEYQRIIDYDDAELDKNPMHLRFAQGRYLEYWNTDLIDFVSSDICKHL